MLAERINRKLEVSELRHYIGKDLPLRTMRKILNRDFRGFGVRTCIIKDDAMFASPFKKRKVLVSGEYYYDGRNAPITLIVHVRPNTTKLRFTKAQMDRAIFLVSQTIQHEAIHKAQCRKRPDIKDHDVKVCHSNRISKKRLEEMAYLGQPIEVDAYAHDIAMEICQYYPTINTRDAFANISKLRRVESFKHYSKAFRGTDWAVLRRTLLKKVWKWMDAVKPVY